MIFVYRTWDKFCKKLLEKNIVSVKASDVIKGSISYPYTVLKHDVETKVKKAYKIAKIENKFGHKGSFYVQAYLLKKQKNMVLLNKIQKMGHEVSYHYDVLDNNRGDIERAKDELKRTLNFLNKTDLKR